MQSPNLDEIIAGLNNNKNIAHLTPNKVDDFGLSLVEKDILKAYKPENSLIVYGTLAPGKPNHQVVESIKGKWMKGIVRGKLENNGWGAELGYLAFKPCGPAEQRVIPAFILVSNALMNNWAMLDEFEGEEYTRILAKYELENGESGIGFIYAANETNE